MNKLLKATLILAAVFFALGGFFLTSTVAARGAGKIILPAQSPTKTPPKDNNDDDDKGAKSKTQTSKTPNRLTSPTPPVSGTKDKSDQNEQSTGQSEPKSEPTTPAVDSKTKEEKGWFDNIWTWLAWGVVGFFGLVFLGLAGWFVFYVLSTLSRERETNVQGFQKVREGHKQLVREINDLSKIVKIQNDRLDQQDKLIHSIRNKLPTGNIGGHTAQTPQFVEPPPVYKAPPQFPVSVENYLNKVRQFGQKATADVIGGLLIQDANKGEEFLIVKDTALPEDLYYAVPSIDRFSTRKDYMTYYQNYYACENPSGGAVWIVAPTTVRSVDGGWRLEDMGELEIR